MAWQTTRPGAELALSNAGLKGPTEADPQWRRSIPGSPTDDDGMGPESAIMSYSFRISPDWVDKTRPCLLSLGDSVDDLVPGW